MYHWWSLLSCESERVCIQCDPEHDHPCASVDPKAPHALLRTRVQRRKQVESPIFNPFSTPNHIHMLIVGKE